MTPTTHPEPHTCASPGAYKSTCRNILEIYFCPLLRLLACFGPELHQQVHAGVGGDGKERHDPRIAPPVIVILQVQRVEVVSSAPVLTDPAVARRIRIREVGSSAESRQILGEVVGAGLACVGSIEDGKLLL